MKASEMLTDLIRLIGQFGDREIIFTGCDQNHGDKAEVYPTEWYWGKGTIDPIRDVFYIDTPWDRSDEDGDE